MDEDTFIAIRALHDIFYDLKDDGGGGDYSSNGKEQHHRHRSIEPPSYNAYAAFDFLDAGDDSQQQEEEHYYPTNINIQSNDYRDVSSSFSSNIHHDIPDSTGEEREQHHPSIESLSLYYDASAAFEFRDAGDDSRQQEGQDHQTIELAIYHDASSSSIHHDKNKTYRMEILSTDLQLERFDITTHSSSCILRAKNTVFIAAILLTMVIYPMLGMRWRSKKKWWVKNRDASSLTNSHSYCEQDMLERGVHR